MGKLGEEHGVAFFMHVRDHAPPHVHAEYGEHEAAICFQTVRPYVLRGSLPPAAQRNALRWIDEHREDLLARWVQRERGEQPERIGEEGQ